MMSRVTSLTLAAVLVSTVLPAQSPRVIRLTGYDSLQYSLTTITATPGETITVVLRTLSMQPAAQMAHNFVILTPGSNVDQFTAMAGLARNHGYLPPQLKGQVLISTAMVAATDTATVTFTVPTRPGSYVYFCTFPAHYSGGMKGTLIVKG